VQRPIATTKQAPPNARPGSNSATKQHGPVPQAQPIPRAEGSTIRLRHHLAMIRPATPAPLRAKHHAQGRGHPAWQTECPKNTGRPDGKKSALTKAHAAGIHVRLHSAGSANKHVRISSQDTVPAGRLHALASAEGFLNHCRR